MVKEFGKYYMLMCKNYNMMKNKFYITYRKATGESMDEDVFHDTLIKCAERLTEDEMATMTEESLINYTYIAFKNNMFREKQYARNRYKADLDIDECFGANDSSDYWDMRCQIKDYIIRHFDEKTFEECCQWIIDRKSVKEIEYDNNDNNLYYKFKKVKELVVKEFGDDLHHIDQS